ncbi:class I SAM-dependent methyltransferase [Candidatus Omnitrophota bacterium]
MDATYIENRNKSHSNTYKLFRRMERITLAIQSCKPGKNLSLLDIGAADGVLLEFLNKRLNLDKAVGVEPSLECVRLVKSGNLKLIQAIGEKLPFKGESFDIVVAASVIDHLSDVNMFLDELRRTLKPKGVLVLTAIVPFYDKLANITGFDKGLHPHVRTFNMRALKKILIENKFNILLSEKFALPSFGLLPFEEAIENFFRNVGLDFFMFYSLVVAENKLNKA